MIRLLQELEGRVRAAIVARRATDPQPDDQFRGLYLSDEAIDALVEHPRDPFTTSTLDPEGRLARLAVSAELTELDVGLLLVALAPDVDSRFEQFYGYLNDDVTRRRASVGLALRLCGHAEASVLGRARLAAGAPLVDRGLVNVEDSDRPFLSRAVRIPDRVVAHLLGDDHTELALAHGVDLQLPGAEALTAALRDGVGLIFLLERPGGSALALAAAALGDEAPWCDPSTLTDPHELLAIVREATLRGSGILLGPLIDGDNSATFKVLQRVKPLVAFGTTHWNPQWSDQVPLQLEAKALPVASRLDLWRHSLPAVAGADLPVHLMLGAPGIVRAARAAALHAQSDGGPVGAVHLRAGARSQNAAGLQRLARRIEPGVGWSDLVLPADIMGQLRELAARARYRDQVLDEWRMRPGGGRGRGVSALFAGDSGTGKTMSAEVIAAELGMDLYAINLATVVDKYVGETEKNLERIFNEAAGVNGVLLFDEADAIFGKRSEVRDAHDRYANIESAYLLQRMEAFDGLAVLATNLRANLDEAFTRRLDMLIDFPVPDEIARKALWDKCLGIRMPRASDVDLDFLAGNFEMAGGHIRSAAVTSAYLAAEHGRPVMMADLIGAVAREYRKLGRLCLEREFGPYLELVR